MGNVVVNWVDDLCMLQGQSGVMYFSGCLEYCWLLFQSGVQYDCLVGVVLLDCYVEFGLCVGDGIVGVLQFFVVNEVCGVQWDVVVQVSLCLGEGGFFDVDICLQLFVVDYLLVGLMDVGGQLGFSFFKCLLGIGLIESDQWIVFLYVVCVVSLDFGYVVCDLSYNLYLIFCYVGIVGFFVVMQYQKLVNFICYGNNNEE